MSHPHLPPLPHEDEEDEHERSRVHPRPGELIGEMALTLAGVLSLVAAVEILLAVLGIH